MGSSFRCQIGLFAWILFLPGFLSAQQTDLDALEKQARRFYSIDLDSSRYFAKQVYASAQAVEDHEKIAWADNWTAITFIKNGLADSVAYYLDRCLAYCDVHPVPEIKGKAHLNQSINASQQGNYELAVQTGLQALEHFQSIDDTLGVAHAHYNTGMSLQRLKKEKAAMDFYRKALPVYMERGGVLDRANTLNAIGTIWKVQLKPDSALYYHTLAANQKLAVNASAYCGSEFSNIAAIHEKAGRTELARQFYGKSYQAFTQIGDQRGRALVSANLSQFKLAIQDWDSAIYYGAISIEHAATSQDTFLLSNSHKSLANAYAKKDNFERSLHHYRVYDSLSNLIANETVRKNVDELHIRFQTEKREKELLKEQVANQEKSFWLIGSAAGIIALLLSIILIYRREQEKKKKLVALGQINLETERHRISMDLHDHLGAELTIITSQLDTYAYQAEDGKTRQQLEGLADQGRAVNAQLRETIWSVQSTTIQLTQFCIKVREFAARILQDQDLHFQCEQHGDTALAPALALDLFRIVQEGIHNAVKYSQASQLKVIVSHSGRELNLAIKDNGIGINKDQQRNGNGLHNMRERVSAHGGSVSISPPPGLAIDITIPLTT